MHAISLFGDYCETNHQLRLLDDIDYFPSGYFNRYQITYAKLASSLSISFLGAVVLFASIYRIGRKNADRTQNAA
jgi:hypothetical protein